MRWTECEDTDERQADHIMGRGDGGAVNYSESCQKRKKYL